jgi:hypothetical protein
MWNIGPGVRFKEWALVLGYSPQARVRTVTQGFQAELGTTMKPIIFDILRAWPSGEQRWRLEGQFGLI